jgi:hypothetical protein
LPRRSPPTRRDGWPHRVHGSEHCVVTAARGCSGPSAGRDQRPNRRSSAARTDQSCHDHPRFRGVRQGSAYEAACPKRAVQYRTRLTCWGPAPGAVAVADQLGVQPSIAALRHRLVLVRSDRRTRHLSSPRMPLRRGPRTAPSGEGPSPVPLSDRRTACGSAAPDRVRRTGSRLPWGRWPGPGGRPGRRSARGPRCPGSR